MLFYAATSPQAGVELYELEYDGSTVSIEDSSNQFTQIAAPSGLIRDTDGNFYYAEQTTDDVWKLGSDFTIDGTWGTAGKLLTPDGAIRAISIDSSGNLALTQVANGGGDDVDTRYFDSTGTEIWTKKLGGANGVWACKFHPNGRVFVGLLAAAVAGTCMVELKALDGSTLQSYTAPHSDGTYSLYSIAIDHLNDVIYASSFDVDAGTYTGLATKWTRGTAVKVWNVDFGGGGRVATASNILFHSNGSIYANFGNTNTTAQAYNVVKVAALDGAIGASYLVHGGSDNANSYDIIELANGEVAVTGDIETNGDGTYQVWILSEGLSFSAGWLVGSGSDAVTALASDPDTAAAIVPPADLKYNKRLVAIANDEVWQESSSGTMEVIPEAANALSGLDVTVGLTAAEAFQKVFIANVSVLKVTEFANSKITISLDGLATSLVPSFGTTISSKNTAAAMVVDGIQRINSTTVSAIYGFVTTSIALAVSDIMMNSAGLSIGVVSIAVGNSLPHFHDWTVYPSVSTTPKTFGSLPGKAALVCLYRGRLILAGNPAYPFQWYMARQNNPYDFAYFANDPQAPVAGGNADAGELGDVITALIPYKDDYLVFGCANTVWVMRGDPAAGGSLDEVSLTTGIFGPMSHCWDDKDNLYFFGTGGIYRIPPGFGPPENLTAGLLPNIVADLGVGPSTHRIVMAYDRRRIGILIAITTLATGANTNYWFDLKTQGFFPETYPAENAIYAAVYYEAQDSDYRRLLIGGADGYIRFFDDDAKDDDIGITDKAVSSYSTFGPIMLSQDPDREGKIISLTVVTGTNTDGLSYDVHVADSAEETIDQVVAGSTPFLTGMVQVDNRVARIRIKCRGIYALIKLYNSTASQTWSIEKVVAQVTEGGRR